MSRGIGGCGVFVRSCLWSGEWAVVAGDNGAYRRASLFQKQSILPFKVCLNDLIRAEGNFLLDGNFRRVAMTTQCGAHRIFDLVCAAVSGRIADVFLCPEKAPNGKTARATSDCAEVGCVEKSWTIFEQKIFYITNCCTHYPTPSMLAYFVLLHHRFVFDRIQGHPLLRPLPNGTPSTPRPPHVPHKIAIKPNGSRKLSVFIA